MSTLYLDHLLNPQSIALVGASERDGSPGLLLATNLVSGDYKGTLYFVNPRYSHVLGQVCHNSIKKLPETPELVILICPERIIRATLSQCAQRGVRVAVVMAAVNDPTRLHQYAQEIGIRILGPFCAGLIP